VTDLAPELSAPATSAPATSAPSTDGTPGLAPLSLLAVVAIALAFVAPIGGVVVGFIALLAGPSDLVPRDEPDDDAADRGDEGERGDGLAFAAILIGATLTLFGVLVPGALALSGVIDSTIQPWG
jgi:hypothetical protein